MILVEHTGCVEDQCYFVLGALCIIFTTLAQLACSLPNICVTCVKPSSFCAFQWVVMIHTNVVQIAYAFGHSQ